MYLGHGVRLQTLLKNNFSAKYDYSYFFCSPYFRFLVFARQPAKYTVENRYKPMQSRFVPEKNDQMSQTDTARIKTSQGSSLAQHCGTDMDIQHYPLGGQSGVRLQKNYYRTQQSGVRQTLPKPKPKRSGFSPLGGLPPKARNSLS